MRKDKIGKIVDRIVARHEKEELEEKGTNNIFKYNLERFMNIKGLSIIIFMGCFLIILFFGKKYLFITLPIVLVLGFYVSWKLIDERYMFRKKKNPRSRI